MVKLARRSIKTKVVSLVMGQLLAALVAIILLVVFLVNELMHQQTQALFEQRAGALNEKLEQKISYLIESAELLTANKLMVNSLTDSEGREAYLTPLLENFMTGKDVLALNLVDFEGHPIYRTRGKLPEYNQSARLRMALALSQASVYLDSTRNNLIVVSPIEYYSTTQGAVIIEFDLHSLVQSALGEYSSGYIKLIKDGQTVYSSNFEQAQAYKTYIHMRDSKLPMFSALGVKLEIGMLADEYNAPIKNAVFALLALGAGFLLLGVIASTWTAKLITQPIMKLYGKVKQSSDSDQIMCYPLGSNDELEGLAKAFDERTMELQFQAEHDSLTGLPNRVLFLDRLKQAIKLSIRSREKMAVLFVDLDHFKEVNDSLGHEVGDELLKQVANKMHATLREFDTIARLGGDEFTILLTSLSEDDALFGVMQKIMGAFKDPFLLKGHQVYTTCSIGISVFPDDAQTPEDLLRNADAAMYRAKTEGRNTYEFYTHDLTEKAYERVVLESKLRRALPRDELSVYYQPQVDMSTGQVIGMEALMRWHHPDDGMIPPDKFIPLAEDTGMIVEIDRWMTRTAIHQFAGWLRSGWNCGMLSINLSMIQLNSGDFIDYVEQLIKETSVPAEKLIFEVTETQAMRNPEKSTIVLRQLQALGVKIAIDDFGTGFSSLAYLKKLPIDRIKIDKSFIDGIPEDKDDVGLTQAIIALAGSLDKGLIAEGVETLEQAEFLCDQGCMDAQGYFYYKPMSASDLEAEILSQAM